MAVWTIAPHFTIWYTPFSQGDKQAKWKLQYNSLELPQENFTFLGLGRREFYLLYHSRSKSKYLKPVLEQLIKMICYRLPFKLSHHVIFLLNFLINQYKQIGMYGHPSLRNWAHLLSPITVKSIIGRSKNTWYPFLLRLLTIEPVLC